MKIILMLIIFMSSINAYDVMSFKDYKELKEIKTELFTKTEKITELKEDVEELKTFKQNKIMKNIILDIENKIASLETEEIQLRKQLDKFYSVLAFN